MLAIGLMLFKIAGLALASGPLLPGFDWRSGFLLGAVVATTDAIAAIQGLVNIATRQQAMLSVLQVERETLIRLRDEGQIDDEVMRVVQRELDLTESRMHSGSFLPH